MAKKTPPRGGRTRGGPSGTGALSRAKKAVVKAAGKVGAAVYRAADAAQEHVVTPVAKAVGLAETPKKARFVREKKAAGTPRAASPALPPRSKTAAGRLMSKNLKLPPKGRPAAGPGPGPKP
jgi:hypothetical protein